MDKSIAGGQEYESPGFDPAAQNDGLPTGTLRKAWAEELRALEQSDSLHVLAHGAGRTGGWLAGLVAAQVITWPIHKALDAARMRVYDAASQRLLDRDQ